MIRWSRTRELTERWCTSIKYWWAAEDGGHRTPKVFVAANPARSTRELVAVAAGRPEQPFCLSRHTHERAEAAAASALDIFRARSHLPLFEFTKPRPPAVSRTKNEPPQAPIAGGGLEIFSAELLPRY